MIPPSSDLDLFGWEVFSSDRSLRFGFSLSYSSLESNKFCELSDSKFGPSGSVRVFRETSRPLPDANVLSPVKSFISKVVTFLNSVVTGSEPLV